MPITSVGKKIGKVILFDLRGKHMNHTKVNLFEYSKMTEDSIIYLLDECLDQIEDNMKLADDNAKKRYATIKDTVLFLKKETISEGESVLSRYLSLYGGIKFGRKHLYIIVGGKYFFDMAYGLQGTLKQQRTLALLGLMFDSRYRPTLQDFGRNVRLHLYIPIIFPNNNEINSLEDTFTPEERDAIVELGSVVQTAMHYDQEVKSLRRQLRQTEERLDDINKMNAKLAKEKDQARMAARAKSLYAPSKDEVDLTNARQRLPSPFLLWVMMISMQAFFVIAFPQLQAIVGMIAGGTLALPIHFVILSKWGDKIQG